jgi:hypothetical protein
MYLFCLSNEQFIVNLNVLVTLCSQLIKEHTQEANIALTL